MAERYYADCRILFIIMPSVAKTAEASNVTVAIADCYAVVFAANILSCNFLFIFFQME
jgi:hypothetical protein